MDYRPSWCTLIRMTTDETKETCANCDGPVSTRGRAPRLLGRRYCRKPECAAAKQAALREVRRPATQKAAPTVCAGCGAALSPRPWRSEDTLGRFCRRVPCQRRKVELRTGSDASQVASLVVRVPALENTIAFLSAALEEARVKCPACGLVDAVPGWPHFDDPDSHPDGMSARCDGTTSPENRSKKLIGSHLAAAWPEMRRYEPGD